jgi:hypothetical protein
MNMDDDVVTQLVLLVLVVILFVGWLWSERWARRKLRAYGDSPTNDPYIESVRAMREANPSIPPCAVSIQDRETGEFYYYPAGSELRMKRNKNGRLYADPAVQQK